jgi:hypothetical protein
MSSLHTLPNGCPTINFVTPEHIPAGIPMSLCYDISEDYVSKDRQLMVTERNTCTYELSLLPLLSSLLVNAIWSVEILIEFVMLLLMTMMMM